ncbi:hypothetical protein E8E14_008163 [Neopestalotiopsis sp. 37M]|nr:hypothetical protein E8E14_008163 [Neopestalotiopsis sp. 37M]
MQTDEPSSPTAATAPIRRHKALQVTCLAIICLTFFIDIANLGMCTIALPTIKDELDFDEGTLQWVMTAYSLTYGSFIMLGGRIGDIFGQEIVLKVAMVAFNIFTLICALVSNKIAFLFGRALQGVAAALTIPSAQAMVGHLFPTPKSHALALSWWGASGSMGFVLGPIIGGLFTSLVSWRWIFWFPLILEGFLSVLALALFRNSTTTKRGSLGFKEIIEKMNPLSTFLSVTGLILLIYALTEGNQIGWGSGAVIGTLVTAVVCLAVFGVVEAKYSSYPFMPPHLWKSSGVPLGCLLAAFTYAVWQGANYFLTLLLQDLGLDALQTAIRFLPLGVTAFLVNMIIPHLLAPVGPNILLLISWLLAIAGVTLFAFVDSIDAYWRLCFPGMILYIAGVGTVYYVTMVVVVTSSPAADQGSVAGIFNVSTGRRTRPNSPDSSYGVSSGSKTILVVSTYEYSANRDTL